MRYAEPGDVAAIAAAVLQVEPALVLWISRWVQSWNCGISAAIHTYAIHGHFR